MYQFVSYPGPGQPGHIPSNPNAYPHGTIICVSPDTAGLPSLYPFISPSLSLCPDPHSFFSLFFIARFINLRVTWKWHNTYSDFCGSRWHRTWKRKGDRCLSTVASRVPASTREPRAEMAWYFASKESAWYGGEETRNSPLIILSSCDAFHRSFLSSLGQVLISCL